MTDEHEVIATDLLQRALDATDHPDKAVSLLMTAGMTILQRRYGAEKAVEHMTAALDVAGASIRAAVHGAAGPRPH